MGKSSTVTSFVCLKKRSGLRKPTYMPLLCLPLTIEFSFVAMLTDQIIPCVAQSTTPTTKHMYNQMRVQIYNVRQNLKTLTSLTRLRYQHHGLFLNVKTRCERITVERNFFYQQKDL